MRNGSRAVVLLHEELDHLIGVFHLLEHPAKDSAGAGSSDRSKQFYVGGSLLRGSYHEEEDSRFLVVDRFKVDGDLRDPDDHRDLVDRIAFGVRNCDAVADSRRSQALARQDRIKQRIAIVAFRLGCDFNQFSNYCIFLTRLGEL